MNDLIDFNPRSLTGATIYAFNITRIISISIHAPSRERQGFKDFTILCDKFQSTLPHGSDPTSSINTLSISEFQSTLPHGSDDTIDCIKLTIPYFNPRSLTGATKIPPYTPIITEISIHAPSRERHNSCNSVYIFNIISIHAPSRERHQIPNL